MNAQPVLITGASGGIGADLARIFAKAGHPLALAARNRQAMEILAAELGNPGGQKPLIVALGLTLPDAPGQLAEALAAASFEPAILVNNAGYGMNGRVSRLDPAGQLGIIDLNIRSLTALTLIFLPSIEKSKGRILNVASTAAFLPGPGMAVYYASKAYVLSFSQALAQEMANKNVTVTALCPGPTATGFFDRVGGYTAKLKSFGMMDSMTVAQAGFDGLMAGRRVVVPGAMNKLMTSLMPFVPRQVLLPIMARLQLGK